MNHFDLFQNNFKTIYPELFLLIAIIFILLHGTILNSSKQFGFPIVITASGWLGIQTLFLTICLILNGINLNTTILHHVLIIDDFTLIIKVIILLSALSCIYICFDFIQKGMTKQKINNFEYIILILFSTLSMLLIVSSYDLISMYLAIELQSLSFYVLAAFQRQNEFSTEAGLKYFVLGAVSSGFLLFGESLVYGCTGITNFEEFSKWFACHDTTTTSVAMTLGILFILVAFLFKISAVPFHMWTPDVYEGAPTSVTAFFAITPKIAILALLLRLCMFAFYDLIESWQTIIIFCSILSMSLGTLGAINQNKIKRLFAYSSIAHVGYLLIGLATGTIESIDSLLVYIIIYILMIINVFGILLAVQQYSNNYYNLKPLIFKTNNPELNSLNLVNNCLTIGNPTHGQINSFKAHRPNPKTIKYITDLAGLAKTNPLLSITFAIVLFSNAGIPPLAGFYGKLNIFLSAMQTSMYALALIGVLCSVVGAFYSIRLVKILYFQTTPNWMWYKTISKHSSIMLAFTLFFTLFFFLYPSFLFVLTHSAALSLCL